MVQRPIQLLRHSLQRQPVAKQLRFRQPPSLLPNPKLPKPTNPPQTTLNFTCTCAANNSAPAEQYYVPTMISFICNQALGDCLKSTAGSQSQQQNCKNTIVCGQTNVSAVSSAAPSSQSATGTATATGSRSAGQATATATNSGSPGATPSKGAADAVKVGQEVKTGVLGAALFALFGLAL